MQIVTGRRGEPHVTSRQMQAVYRSFLGDFALLDIGEKLRAEAYSNDIVRVYDGVVSVQGIYAVIAYNQYDEVYIEPVSVGKKRIDTIVLHYTKDSTLDVEDMQLDVVHGDEYTDNPIPPTVDEGGDAWEGATDIQVPIYDVEVTNFGLTVIPHARMLTVIPTLDSIAERIPETVVTGVKGDSEVLYRDGDVNITKANIGLGNVDNTADTDKPISTATQTALNLKADLTYVDAKISAAYHAGGSKTVAELTSALLIADNIGKVYNMSDSGVTTSDFVEGAGEPINEGDNVGICNVGTEESPVYKFDLLSGFVDLSAYATTIAVNTALAGKVDKVAGKGLSTEDYTTTDKTKLAGISEGATQTIANPVDTATETLSKLEVGGVVFDIPQGASGATELSELTDVNLSDVEDNDILQYDETDNKWKNSNALQGAKTATGNPITVSDAAPVNAVNLSMDLEPIQDLHGYDHPWVGGAGKNKIDENYSTSYTNAVKLQAGTYYYQGFADAPSHINTRLEYSDDNSTWEMVGIDARITTSGWGGGWIESGIATMTFTTTAELYFRVWIVEGTLDNRHLSISSEQLTTFAPYSNICPISGRSEVAIQRVGKNLFDKNATDKTKNHFIDYTTGNVTYSTNWSISGYIKTKDGVSYALSGMNNLSTTNFTVAFYDKNKTFIRGVSSQNMTFTIPSGEGIEYIRFDYKNADENTIQLELGNTTTYEPYAGKTYTIQIGQTVYGGQLDVTRGKMVVDKGYAEFDGSSDEAWNRGNPTYRFYIQQSDAKVSIDGVISNQFKSGWQDNALHVGTINNVNCIDFQFDANSSITSVEALRTYLTSNPLQVCYELAEPFTIDLTPQQIKMLENTNTIYTGYEGDTIHIEYQPNNAIGEAVRAVEESYDPEFAVRPVLKKKAFSGTTDSDGAVTLINASDIPSGHKIIPLHITDMTIDGSAGTYFVEYEPYNSGDSVKGYCYFYMSGSQMFPVGKAITGNFYYYELEV